MRSDKLTIEQIIHLKSVDDLDKYSDSLQDYKTFIQIRTLKEKGFMPISSDIDANFSYKVYCTKCGKKYDGNQGQKILKHYINHLYREGRADGR